MKIILLTFFLVFIISCGQDKQAPHDQPVPRQDVKKTVSVTSLNIEWFGIGGRMTGTPDSEKRDNHLRKFFKDYFSATDIFIFQEIIDVKRLNKLIPKFNCSTYPRHNQRHQHIVACVRNSFKFTTNTFDSVDLGNPGLRPALQAEVEINAAFKLQVIGVHLKAKPQGSDKRLTQINALTDEMDTNTKTLIVGDFNTYDINKNGQTEDDDDLITDVLDDFGFQQVGEGVDTFIRWGGGFAQFDRGWARNLNVVGPFLAGPCNKKFPIPFNDIDYYTRNISDHCPITFKVSLK